eukprot:48955_1
MSLKFSTIVTIIYAALYVVTIFITSIFSCCDVRNRKQREDRGEEDKDKETELVVKKEETGSDEKEPFKEANNEVEIDDDSTNKDEKKTIYHKNPVIHWAKLMNSKKKIYWGLLPHTFDVATDIGVVMEYYALYKAGKRIGSLNPFWLFCISISIIVSSRIISSFAVYSITRRGRDAVLQLFDLLMMKAVFTSYKLNAAEPTTMQRYLGLLEAILESAPQILLNMIVILKFTEEGIHPSSIVLVSLLFSLWSLVSRVIADDKLIFKEEWVSLEFEYDKCPIVNKYYVFRSLFRWFEISNRICIWTLCWVSLGGFALSIIIGFECIYLVILCIISRSPIALGNLMYLVGLNWEQENIIKLMTTIFWVYRITSLFIYLILITIFVTTSFKAPKVEEFAVRKSVLSGFGFFLLIYGWITAPLWIVMGCSALDKGMRFEGVAITNRSAISLAQSNNFEDLLQLMVFGISSISKQDLWWITYITLGYCHETELGKKILSKVNEKDSEIWDYRNKNKDNSTALIYVVRFTEVKSQFQFEHIKHVLMNYDLDLEIKDEQDHVLKDFFCYVKDRETKGKLISLCEGKQK